MSCAEILSSIHPYIFARLAQLRHLRHIRNGSLIQLQRRRQTHGRHPATVPGRQVLQSRLNTPVAPVVPGVLFFELFEMPPAVLLGGHPARAAGY
ncbi:MAG: hypothetical protein U0U70_13220 [Chitinophagaceae bacterium]